MKGLTDLIEHQLEENDKHNRAREADGKPTMGIRTQAGLIAYAVEQEMKKSIADQVWNLLFPTPPTN